MKIISVEVKFLSVIAVLITGVTLWLITYSDSNPIPLLIKQNVISTSGVAWDSGRLVTINPFNSKEVIPCAISTDGLFVSKQPPSYSKGVQTKVPSKPRESVKTAYTDCNGQITPQIVVSDNSSSDKSLQQVVKISESPIKGTVRIDGEDKEARFIVTVTALYQGSHCATTYASGSHRTFCVNHHDYCVALEKRGLRC